MNNATIGAAVLGGYLLGRTKKAKLALGLGALLAGSQVRPGQLGKAVDAPFLGDLTRQIRTELTGAGKAAATSVLSSKADSLAGTLHERTAGLRERAEGKGAQDEAEAETDADTEPDDETEDETDDDRGGEDEANGPDEDDGERGEDGEDEQDAKAAADDKGGQPRKRPAKRSGGGTGGTTARRGDGGSTGRRGGSAPRKSAPRATKKTATASRSRSGSGSRSRRQDDG